MKWSCLTTPPPPRAPGPKHPLFTRKVFATKSWGPGHVIGLGILALGTYGITKAFISAHEARIRTAVRRPEDEPARGQYR